MRRAIVTGATGFLGRHLVQDLRRHGVHVIGLARSSRMHEQSWLIAMGDAPWPSDRIARIVDAIGPDVIFHLTGGAAGSQPELMAANVGVTRALLRALHCCSVHPLLLCCGSAAEYGASILDGVAVDEATQCAPVTPYGIAKFAQTEAVLEAGAATGMPVLVGRIFNMIGAGMPSYLALGGFACQIAGMPANGGVLRTGNLHVFRDFIEVGHVATAFRLLAQNDEARGIVNICSGEATELNELVEILIREAGRSVRTEVQPERVRPEELQCVIGDASHLVNLGVVLPRTDYADVVAQIWKAASACDNGE